MILQGWRSFFVPVGFWLILFRGVGLGRCNSSVRSKRVAGRGDRAIQTAVAAGREIIRKNTAARCHYSLFDAAVKVQNEIIKLESDKTSNIDTRGSVAP